MKKFLFVIGGLFFAYICAALVLFMQHDRHAQNVSFAFPTPKIVDVPAWERKKDLSGEVLKVGLITDTHLDSKRIVPKGDPLKVRIPDRYQKMLDAFVGTMKDFNPAFIVHLGDVIEGTKVDKEVGIIELGLIRDAVMRAEKTTYWAIGNHDLRSVSRRNFIEALEIDYVNGVIDHGPYRLILLDANFRNTGVPSHPMSGDYVPGFVPKETMAWLEEQLKTDQHVYVFVHHSLVPVELTDKNPVANHAEVRALLSEYNVQAVFEGHIEKRFYGVLDGVEYYAFPGIKKHATYPGAYYTMTLVEGVPEVEMYYENPETGAPMKESFVREGVMIGDLLKAAK